MVKQQEMEQQETKQQEMEQQETKQQEMEQQEMDQKEMLLKGMPQEVLEQNESQQKISQQKTGKQKPASKKFFVLKEIEKSYGEGSAKVKVLDGVSVELEEGKICVILGPSGSGKSTLLNVVGGLESIDSGSIYIDNQDISKLDVKRLGAYRRNKLGFVFQFYNLIPNLTVKENIEACEYLSKNPLPIDELLQTLGMWEHKNKFPNQLSGGQQQRCAIGRALVKNPALLLCDEPTGALDYKNSKELLELIERINQKYNNTIIIVTHNEAIKNMAHRVLKLHDGRIIKDYVNDTIVSAKDLEW